MRDVRDWPTIKLMLNCVRGISDGSLDWFEWNFWVPDFFWWQEKFGGKFGPRVLPRKLQYKIFVLEWNVFKDGVKWGKGFKRGWLWPWKGKLIGDVKETKFIRYFQWKSNLNASSLAKQMCRVEIKTRFCAIKGTIWIKFGPFGSITGWNSSSVLLKDENHIVGSGHPWSWLFQVIERNDRWRKWE